MLVQSIISGVVSMGVATGLATTMTNTYQQQIKAELRDNNRRAFSLVERHLADKQYPDVVNGCQVLSYSAYQPDKYGRDVTISCTRGTGKYNVTKTQLVPCEPCAQAAAEATEPPVDEPFFPSDAETTTTTTEET